MLLTPYLTKIALYEFTDDERINFKGVSMIEIQLSGSTGAYCGAYSYSHPRKDPVAPLLRKMVADGYCHEYELVVVKRGDTICFNPEPITSWISKTIMCQDKGGITKTKYVPFDRFTGDE